MDAFSHYALYVCDQAVEDSGILSSSPNLDRIGVIWGSGNRRIKHLFKMN